MVNGLAVIGYHARLQTEDEDPSLMRPELCPLDDIFRLLIDLISECKCIFFNPNHKESLI